MQMDISFQEKTECFPGGKMLQLSDVDKILSLCSCGWGTKRIASELGISRRIVKKYIRLGKWKPPAKRISKKLIGLDEWLQACYEKHKGNADVVRQELITEHNIHVSLRTVERAVQKWRQEAIVKAKATVRYETAPGKQLQIDFGSTKILIGEQLIKVYLFVATLGYSRRLYVAPFLHERQTVWFKGIEGAFSHFGGITEEILLDNAKPLVTSHNPVLKEVIFNDRFKAFAQYWGFKPIACSPYRARTKGKDERMVGYVKKNAIAGHTFEHWDAFLRHLERWNAEIADLRIHGTVEEKPLERFLRDEVHTLKTLLNKPSFIQIRELSRKVHVDACIELDTNHYSVPCSLVGQCVTIQVVNDVVRIFHKNLEVSCHTICEGRRKQIVDIKHLKGIVGSFVYSKSTHIDSLNRKLDSELLRPLSEYEALTGGGW